MEACGSAHYWSREFRRMAHVVKLIAPQYVRPFVKRQKNDAADAEAIVVAAQRPEMRFIEQKTQEQQAKAVLFRSRGRLVNQRTEVINGAMSRLTWLGRKSIRPGSWLDRMLARKPIMLVAIALANRMARQIWSMLMKGEDYRNPASLAAA